MVYMTLVMDTIVSFGDVGKPRVPRDTEERMGKGSRHRRLQPRRRSPRRGASINRVSEGQLHSKGGRMGREGLEPSTYGL